MKHLVWVLLVGAALVLVGVGVWVVWLSAPPSPPASAPQPDPAPAPPTDDTPSAAQDDTRLGDTAETDAAAADEATPGTPSADAPAPEGVGSSAGSPEDAAAQPQPPRHAVEQTAAAARRANAITGRLLAVDDNNAIASFANDAAVDIGMRLYVYDPQDEQVATLRVVQDVTPVQGDIGDVKWWAGTVQVLEGKEVEEEYRVSSLAE